MFLKFITGTSKAFALGKELQFVENQTPSAPTLVATWEGAPSGRLSFDFELPDMGLLYIIGDNISIEDTSSSETQVYELGSNGLDLFYLSFNSYNTDTYTVNMYGMETIPIANGMIFNSVGSPFTCWWNDYNMGTEITNVRLRFYVLTFQS